MKRNINAMAVGEEFTLEGAEVAGLRLVGIFDTEPSKEGVESRPYAQVAYGPISFTINEKEDIDQVSTRALRDDIAEICLNITEYSKVEMDPTNGNEILNPDGSKKMVTVRGLGFVYMRTWDGMDKLAERQGKNQAIKSKWATVSVADKQAALALVE